MLRVYYTTNSVARPPPRWSRGRRSRCGARSTLGWSAAAPQTRTSPAPAAPARGPRTPSRTPPPSAPAPAGTTCTAGHRARQRQSDPRQHQLRQAPHVQPNTERSSSAATAVRAAAPLSAARALATVSTTRRTRTSLGVPTARPGMTTRRRVGLGATRDS
eukprot:1196251-Prorocentrum_minimum.AAC.2